MKTKTHNNKSEGGSEMNTLQKVELEEIQDKIKAINYAIENGCTPNTYKTNFLPRLEILIERREEIYHHAR